jgi:hypothetical protein
MWRLEEERQENKHVSTQKWNPTFLAMKAKNISNNNIVDSNAFPPWECGKKCIHIDFIGWSQIH